MSIILLKHLRSKPWTKPSSQKNFKKPADWLFRIFFLDFFNHYLLFFISGLGSLIALKPAEPSDDHRNSLLPSIILTDNDIGISTETEKRNVIFYENGEFKATKKTIKEMLVSHRQLEQKYNTMKVGYDDYKKKADLYKRMVSEVVIRKEIQSR